MNAIKGKILFGESTWYNAILEIDDVNSEYIIEVFDIQESNEVIYFPPKLIGGTFEKIGQVSVLFPTIAGSSISESTEIYKYKTKWLIVGYIFPSIDKIKAKRLYLQTDILFKVFKKNSIKRIDSLNIQLEKLYEIELVRKNGISISIVNSYSDNQYFNSLHIDENRFLKVESTNEEYVWDLNEIALRVKNLFYLLGYYDEEPKDKVIYNYIDKDSTTQRFELWGLYHRVGIRAKTVEPPGSSAIESIDKDRLWKWIFTDGYQGALKNLLSKHFNKKQSREVSFFSSCLALEQVHRDFINRKSYFIERLKYFEEDFRVILPDSIVVDNYLQRIRFTRNEFAHFTQNRDSFKGKELNIASLVLEMVVIRFMCRELGLEVGIIDKMFKYAKGSIEYYMNYEMGEYSIPTNLFNELT